MIDQPTDEEIVLLAHGGGGRLTESLLADHILPPFANPILDRFDDGACLSLTDTEVVLTTDYYVVHPLGFPGGNIGLLAAAGTINDLVMQGARPRFLTCALIIEEGLSVADLGVYVRCLAETAAQAGVMVVAGDTKVVERGKGSGLFINTAGLGTRLPGVDVSIGNGSPGDAVIVTGTLADHGIAVLNEREQLGLQADFRSDAAQLWGLMAPLFRPDCGLRCLRDPTRGGLAGALCHLAEASAVGVHIDEESLPGAPAVRAACDLLGLDILNVANEGKAMVVCAWECRDRVLGALRNHPLGRNAALIGRLTSDHPALVVLRTRIGGERLVVRPAGNELPRIC